MSRHPAHAMPFAELRAALQVEREAGRVFVRTDGPLELYGYTLACQYGGEWNEINYLARGLVLDVEAGRIAATSFPKFWNLGERMRATELPAEPFAVTEKMDGSLGIVFHHAGAWRVVTRGSLTSEQGAWATAWLRSHANTEALDPSATYLTEIVYAANRIVITYGFEGLVLLAGYGADGYELGRRAALEGVATASSLRLVQAHDHASVDELLAVAQTLKADREGFVVRFASGLRVKVKGAEYCRIHRLISNVTPLAVWEILAAGDDPDILRRDLPEEFHRDFDRIRTLIEVSFNRYLWAVREAYESTATLEDAALGKAMQAGVLSRWSPDVLGMVFPCRKKGALDAMHKPGEKLRRKAFETFRPTGNVLMGYVPSGAVNRFQEEVTA